MSPRRAVPLVAAVVVLLAVVALAARGRPLSTGGARGSGPPTAFWDYTLTSLLILVPLVVFAGLWALRGLRPDPMKMRLYPGRVIRSLVILGLVIAFIVLVGSRIHLHHLFHPNAHPQPTARGPGGRHPGPSHRHARRPATHPTEFKWDELIVVLVVLAILGAWAFTRRGKREAAARPGPGTGAAAELAAAFDESLDDLRADPDLRRAIIAAYARMERALAAAGIPRRPAEAPLEYLERALGSLRASAAAVRTLTDLFEWARFSQHEPEPSMRDEAVDALVAVRDELRAVEPVAA